MTAHRLNINYLNPDYPAVFRQRLATLKRLREQPQKWDILKAHYKHHPEDLISDWGCTYDPRLIERGISPIVPFVLFPRQVELVRWMIERWRAGEAGLCDKSRDMGVSWVAVGVASALCLTHHHMAIGFGSRKEEYVDKLDSPKSLFYKARMFLQHLPVELRGGWTPKSAPYMRIKFPNTNSVMTGEAGDSIGRGDRTALYFVDEAAHLERPQAADAALSATTNCRIDISSPNGRSNPFAMKRFSWPARRVFSMHWRDDPRKDDAWYQRQVEQLMDPVVIAQEIDLSYDASVRGVVIPAAWVHAAIDAHIKLGLQVAGEKRAGLDIADEGPDINCLAGRHGIVLTHLSPWSGKSSDLYETAERALHICRDEGFGVLRYDADGLGLNMRGDARKVQEDEGYIAEVEPFKGSGGVLDPDMPVPTATDDPDEKDRYQRTNADYFANVKAQAWFALRLRFLRTYRAVILGHPVTDPDGLISLSSRIPDLQKLLPELSQPVYKQNGAGKMLIDKAPDGTRSPNMADSVMIAYAPTERLGGFFS